jgi:L-2-hydroxyglutarate oxidase LhgO
MKTNILIIGAGVIGLAVAYKLSKKHKDILIVDSESSFGLKTSSRNTQVIHAGIYYNKGSLKSKLCLRGKNLMYNFCENFKVPYKKNKKIFIATNDNEISNLNLTMKQAKLNGVNDLKELSKNELLKAEPYVDGVCGLLSPSSGIVDGYNLMSKLLDLCIDNDVNYAPNHEIIDAKQFYQNWKIKLKSDSIYSIDSNIVINCAGNNSTTISKNFFNNYDIPDSTPVKGSYLRYNEKSMISHTIYPALKPGNNIPRVDATPDIDNVLRFGPSTELNEPSYNVDENLIDKFYPVIKNYIPTIKKNKLSLDFCGFRPKISINKKLVDDYIIKWSPNKNWLDLWGIDSPGLTSCLSIAEHVENMIENL